MEITYAQVQTYLVGLSQLGQQPLPPKTAIKIARVGKVVKTAVEALDEVRADLRKRHEIVTGEVIPEDESKRTPNQKAYVKDIMEAVEEKTTLAVEPLKVNVKELGGANLFMSVILALDGLIEFTD